MALYFGATIDRSSLRAEKVGRIARNIFVLLVGVFGIFGIAAPFFETWPAIEQLFAQDYWISASNGKLVLAISLLTDLYLIARVLRRGEGQERVTVADRHPEERSDEGSRDSRAGRDSSPRPFMEQRTGKGGVQNDRIRSKQIDVSRALSDDLRMRLRNAYRFAVKMNYAEVGLLELTAGLLDAPAVSSLLARFEIDRKGLRERLLHILQKGTIGGGDPVFGETAKQIVVAAYADAQTAGGEQVETYHVFWEAVKAHEGLQEIFFDLGITKDQLTNAVRWFEINDELHRRWRRFRGAAAKRPKGAMNRAMTALQTRFLDRYSDDLTRLAGRGYLEWTVDRAKEFDAIFRVLQGERKSIVLVGPYGVGKEAILNGIAERMIEEEVPDVLKDRRLAVLSIPKLVAGATPSEAQKRMLVCFNDIAQARNVVLAIPNVHELVGAQQGGLDLSEVLAGELGKGYFLTIATTTPEEYRERIEGSELGSALLKVDIEEPSQTDAIQILESKAGAIEHRSKTFFSYTALEKAVVLSDAYLKDRALPEKAIDIAKEAAQYAFNKRGAKTLVRGEDAAQIVAEKSHVPVTSVTEKEADKLVHLEADLHARIVGQDEAVRAVASALRRARAGLREGKRPIASFLFLGPTGVGKTETAKTVAEVYFGGEERMIRLDMSEYQDKTGVARLLGAPGERGGLLSEPVRKNPFSLVLLDEIEKAQPDILNVFLQVMDDGRATDSAGRVIDFTNTIIIMTSNAGTQFVQESLKHERMKTLRQDEIMAQIKDALIERELKQYFKPEFLNRFDGIVVYTPLTEPQLVEIARLGLKKVAKQMESKGIMFSVDDEAVVKLAHEGFDPKFGARPLRRVIQERVQDALANLLLEKKLGRRDTVVLEKGGELRVEKAEKL